MRKITCLVLAAMLVPAHAFAWGAATHRYITGRAIEILPAEIKPFFTQSRDELVLRSNDPDLWRVAGFEQEPPNHQIDLGVDDYGPYPFSILPRELGAAVEKFGTATLTRHGLLPWRVTEEFGNLTRIMTAVGRNQLYSGDNAILFSAALGHYVQDATQSFHVTNNFNGQMTGQSGIHSRFESELFERFQSRLMITPAPAMPVSDASAFIWDTILASNQLVPAILDADKAAAMGKSAYDDDYFEKFFTRIHPVLEQQLGKAITATASMIAGAWENAGKPALHQVSRQLERVRP